MEFGNKIFFFSFSSYLISFWLKIMPERGILIFLIFYYIFRNFLARVEYERNSGLKFFFLFHDLSNPVLAKNNAEKRFFNFLISFSFFLRIFLLGSSMNGIRDLNFFLPFSAYLIPFWLKLMPKRGVFYFLNFFAIFFGIFFPGSSMNGIRD